MILDARVLGTMWHIPVVCTLFGGSFFPLQIFFKKMDGGLFIVSSLKCFFPFHSLPKKEFSFLHNDTGIIQ